MELTVKNIYDILKNDVDFDENMIKAPKSTSRSLECAQIFKRIVTNLLNNFFVDYKILKLSSIKKDGANLVHSNERMRFEYRHEILKNVTRIKIKNIYPNTIVKLTEYENYNLIDHSKEDPFDEETWLDGNQNKILWNIPEYSILYKFILENSTFLKEFKDERVSSIIDYIIDYTYVSISEQDFLKINNLSLISTFIATNMTLELSPYRKNTIMCYVDTLFFLDFEKIEKDVYKILDSLGFQYEKKTYLNMIYNNYSRYILSNNELEVVGASYLETLEKSSNKEKTKKSSEDFEWKTDAQWWSGGQTVHHVLDFSSTIGTSGSSGTTGSGQESTSSWTSAVFDPYSIQIKEEEEETW